MIQSPPSILDVAFQRSVYSRRYAIVQNYGDYTE